MNGKLNFAALALGFSLVASAAHAIPSNGLVAYWSGDNTTVDGSGHGHDGTWVGAPSYVPGVVGNAFNLQGPGTFIDIPDSPAWAFGTNDFTISFFANVTSSVTAGTIGQPAHVFIGQDQGGGLQNKWFIGLGSDTLEFHLNYDGTGPVLFLDQVTYPAAANVWHDIVLRRTGNVLEFFMDGVSLGTETTTASVSDVNHSLRLGESEGFELQGYLDEVAIYSRSLSQDELNQLAQDPGPPAAPEPLTLSLFGMGLAGLGFTRRRKR